MSKSRSRRHPAANLRTRRGAHRQWLNAKPSQQAFSMLAWEVWGTSRHAYLDCNLTIHDCSRSIELDFGVDGRTREQLMRKIEARRKKVDRLMIALDEIDTAYASVLAAFDEAKSRAAAAGDDK